MGSREEAGAFCGPGREREDVQPTRKGCRKGCPHGASMQCDRRATPRDRQGEGRHPTDEGEGNTVEGRQGGCQQGSKEMGAGPSVCILADLTDAFQRRFRSWRQPVQSEALGKKSERAAGSGCLYILECCGKG